MDGQKFNGTMLRNSSDVIQITVLHLNRFNVLFNFNFNFKVELNIFILHIFLVNTSVGFVMRIIRILLK